MHTRNGNVIGAALINRISAEQEWADMVRGQCGAMEREKWIIHRSLV